MNIDILQADRRIGALISSAGGSLGGTFVERKTGHVAQLGTLSTVAVARQRRGAAAYEAGMAVISISSVVGLAPELGMAACCATKAFATLVCTP